MKIIYFLAIIALCLCFPLHVIITGAQEKTDKEYSSADIILMKKIASQSITRAFEKTKDLKEVASLVGVETSELEQLCIALGIDFIVVPEKIQPVEIVSPEKIKQIENEAGSVLMNDGSTPYVIIVEKSSHTLFLIEFNNGKRRVVKAYECKTGKNQGDKKMPGDKKTPEGIYFLTRKYLRKNIENIVGKQNAYQYGELAFVTNFPNSLDRLNGKKGSGIWLHGTDENFEETSSNDTRGCVVTTNKTITELDSYIVPGETFMIVVDSLAFIGSDNVQKRKKEALSTINNWKNAWEQKDINGYINHYSNSFSSQGLSRSGWEKDKKGKWKRNNDHRVVLDDIVIFQFNGGIVAHFTQHFSIMDKTNTKVVFPTRGMKTIYLVQENASWKIVSENFHENR